MFKIVIFYRTSPELPTFLVVSNLKGRCSFPDHSKVFHWYLSLVMIQPLYPCRYVVVLIVSRRGQKTLVIFCLYFKHVSCQTSFFLLSLDRPLKWANEYCFQGLKVDAAFSFSSRPVNSSLLRSINGNTEYDRSH